MSWSSFGKKVFSGASKAVRLGAKYSGVVESVASKVASGAGAAAIGAAALGLEPIAAGLGERLLERRWALRKVLI